MKVLLTGANGQLGLCLLDRFPTHWQVFATDHHNLDITHQQSINDALALFKPDVIINAAAYTAVDKAEQDQEQANLVNHIGPKYLAEAAAKNNIRLIHISTDYVFDGDNNIPYVETNETCPVSVYGKTKLDGEQAVMLKNSNSIILRTAWVFSEYGSNFVKTMLNNAHREILTIVDDQIGIPTYAGDLAQAIIQIIEKNDLPEGIYHYSGDKVVSWYQFAQAIFMRAKEQGLITTIPILKAIPSEQYKTLAVRPKYSVLNCDKISQFGYLVSNWQLALEKIITRLGS